MLSFGKRVSYAFKAFFSLLDTGTIPTDVLTGADRRPDQAPAAPEAPVPAPAVVPGDALDRRAVQVLAVLQRDGRLVDFLREDLSAYTDAQIGAGVRDVHANCRQALDRYFPVEAILADAEGDLTALSAPVDPSAVSLIGHVPASASTYRGTVRHRGWRVTQVALPPLPPGDTPLVVAPAEVEVA